MNDPAGPAVRGQQAAAAAQRDRAGALLCLALAGWAGWVALTYRLEDLGEPGSGLFPFLSALGLGALALLLLLRPTREPDAESGPIAWGKVAGYVLALAAYALLLEPLGHLLVTALTLGAIMLVLERIAWPRALAVTAGAVLASWLLFERLLGVPLPHGPLG